MNNNKKQDKNEKEKMTMVEIFWFILKEVKKKW